MSAGLTTPAGLGQRGALRGAGEGPGHPPWKWRFYKQWKAKQRKHYLQRELLRSKQQLTYGSGLALPTQLFTVLMTRDRFTANRPSTFITVIIVVVSSEAGTAEPWTWTDRWLQVECKSGSWLLLSPHLRCFSSISSLCSPPSRKEIPSLIARIIFIHCK